VQAVVKRDRSNGTNPRIRSPIFPRTRSRTISSAVQTRFRGKISENQALGCRFMSRTGRSPSTSAICTSACDLDRLPCVCIRYRRVVAGRGNGIRTLSPSLVLTAPFSALVPAPPRALCRAPRGHCRETSGTVQRRVTVKRGRGVMGSIRGFDGNTRDRLLHCVVQSEPTQRDAQSCNTLVSDSVLLTTRVMTPSIAATCPPASIRNREQGDGIVPGGGKWYRPRRDG
jgi:hypothetical protein